MRTTTNSKLAKCNFQNQVKSDIKKKVKKPDTEPANPSRKKHELLCHEHNHIRKIDRRKLTKTYKESRFKVVEILNVQSAGVAKQLKLDDRIKKLAESPHSQTIPLAV